MVIVPASCQATHVKARHTADPMSPRLVLENKYLAVCRAKIELALATLELCGPT